jgi:hypothetical protein
MVELGGAHVSESDNRKVGYNCHDLGAKVHGRNNSHETRQ